MFCHRLSQIINLGILISLLMISSISLAVDASEFGDTSESGNYTLENIKLFKVESNWTRTPITGYEVDVGTTIEASVDISSHIPSSNGIVSVYFVAIDEDGYRTDSCTGIRQEELAAGNSLHPATISSYLTLAPKKFKLYAYLIPYVCYYYGKMYLWSNILSQEISVVGSNSVYATKVRVAQSVYNPSLGSGTVDLVQGKPASFEVTLEGKNSQLLRGKSITVSIKSAGNVLWSKNKSPIYIPEDFDNKPMVITADQMTPFTVPPPQMNIGLTVTVEDASPEEDPEYKLDTKPFSFVVNTYKTFSPNIGLITIGGCTGNTRCYDASSNTELTTMANVLPFLSNMLPFAEPITHQYLQTPFKGQPKKTGQKPDAAIIADTANLMLIKVTQDSAKAGTVPLNRVFAAVHQDYFAYHGYPTTLGAVLQIQSLKLTRHVGFVVANAVNSFAHEFGHTFGVLNEDYYVNPVSGVTSSQPVPEGYDARNGALLIDKISFLGTAGNKSQSDYWIRNEIYTTIFQNALKQSFDPKIIYVSGVINSDGSAEIFNSGISENGNISENEGNTGFSIRTLDSSGKVLREVISSDEISLKLFYDVENSANTREIKFNDIPFAVGLPYDTEAVAFEIAKGNTIIAKNKIGYTSTPPVENPQDVAITLDKILKKIPNSAFKILPALSRSVLQIKADSVNKAFSKKKYNEALVLTKLFEAEVRILVKESYSIKPEELTKKDVLKEISKYIEYIKKEINKK